ncbi:nitrilase-related carbon-nitrogen hydrolase [Chelatococcus reniformis]|uniref:Nitrilase n=1 Tax=Chelatococcus reniformis TaxID=1494448 RepID=A0A916UYW8_9HYPH|nr:nitrilase-related carbon-nitrogen hydrolase [Chelatococcus reniformis]GGC92268.1 nitrilase [Chelatococcus reniformis]
MDTHSPYLARLDPVRVAVVQGTPAVFDVAGTLDRVRAYAADAAGRGARLCVFPEAFLSGYPRGFNFDSPMATRMRLGRSAPPDLRESGHFVTYWQSAIEVPGPATEALSTIAAETRQHVVIGVTERDGGTLYCTVLFFGPDGRLLGKHRKLMPTGNERMLWGFGDGSTLPVLKTEIGNIGAALCYENYMPLLRTKMYADGVTIYCAPTAASGELWSATMQHIAMEGGCFVLGCNQFTRQRDYPPEYAAGLGNEPDRTVSAGGSCIVDPTGRFLAEPAYEGDTILIADLDPTAIINAKALFDSVGHYSRPDVFQLTVNERRNTLVAAASGQPDGLLP